MRLKHKFWIFAFLVIFSGCASMEQAKSFNEQLDYADAGIDGIAASATMQYQAGVITKEVKDQVASRLTEALDAIQKAKSLSALQKPEDAMKTLQDAQVIILELQKELAKGTK